MSFSNFTPHVKMCQHNLPFNQDGTPSCRTCFELQKSKKITQSVCSHGIKSIDNTCWACEYDKNHKKCFHNIIESNCNICKWKQIPPQQHTKVQQQMQQAPLEKKLQGVCAHWISLTNDCYICNREKERQKHFHNSNVKITDSNNFFDDRISQLSNYVNPDSSNKQYSKLQNSTTSSSYNTQMPDTSKELFGRELNNRSKETNVNSFMKRSLDTVGFMETNNSKNIWSNPIVNSSFPTTHISENDIESNYLGVTTRGHRKLDDNNFNGDLHLRRSMLQPDLRQGNRFFELKPASTRRESFRNVGNESAIKFQNQTEELYKKMNYTQSYDAAAGINRG
jgi:hypothetical protein